MLTFSCLKFSAHSFSLSLSLSLSLSNPLLKLFDVGKFCTVIKRKGICLCRFCPRPSKCSFECDMKTDNSQTYKLQVTFQNTENITFNNSGVGKMHFRNTCEMLNCAPKSDVRKFQRHKCPLWDGHIGEEKTRKQLRIEVGQIQN